jgi:hypothetical protein
MDVPNEASTTALVIQTLEFSDIELANQFFYPQQPPTTNTHSVSGFRHTHAHHSQSPECDTFVDAVHSNLDRGSFTNDPQDAVRTNALVYKPQGPNIHNTEMNIYVQPPQPTVVPPPPTHIQCGYCKHPEIKHTREQCPYPVTEAENCPARPL